MPGLSEAFGRNAGGHHTDVSFRIIGMPRRSVGSKSEARKSTTGRFFASAICRTMLDFPIPGAPQMNTAQGWDIRPFKTEIRREAFIGTPHNLWLYGRQEGKERSSFREGRRLLTWNESFSFNKKPRALRLEAERRCHKPTL